MVNEALFLIDESFLVQPGFGICKIILKLKDSPLCIVDKSFLVQPRFGICKIILKLMTKIKSNLNVTQSLTRKTYC